MNRAQPRCTLTCAGRSFLTGTSLPRPVKRAHRSASSLMSPVTSGQLSSIPSTPCAVCLDALNGTSEPESDEEVGH